MRRSAVVSFLFRVLFVVVLANHPITKAAEEGATPAPAPSTSRTLTVDRIYGEPSLSGQLTSGLAWGPDGKRIGFFSTVTTGATRATGKELWIMDAASGKSQLLVSASKLESVLPGESGYAMVIVGLRLHTPAQY